MLVTKSKFKEMFGYKDLSCISRLLKKGTIVANENGKIDLEDKKNKRWLLLRTNKLEKKQTPLKANNKNYTIMSTRHLFNPDLSHKAKGLFSLFLALPPDYDYSIENIISISKESKDSIRSTLNELKTFGYLHIEKIMPDTSKDGRFKYVYHKFENQIDNPYLT